MSADVQWGEPQPHLYRDRLGETEYFIVLPYRLTQIPLEPPRLPAHLELVTGDGERLSDGYRPLVHASFCRVEPCGRRTLSTPHLLAAHSRAADGALGLAIFRVPGELPDRIRIGLVGAERGKEYSLSAGRYVHTPQPAPSLRAEKAPEEAAPRLVSNLHRAK